MHEGQKDAPIIRMTPQPIRHVHIAVNPSYPTMYVPTAVTTRVNRLLPLKKVNYEFSLGTAILNMIKRIIIRFSVC